MPLKIRLSDRFVMYDCQLLIVEEHFQLNHDGLVVMPDFPVPQNGGWKNFEAIVKVVPPEGRHSVYTAHFQLSHAHIVDPQVSNDKRWRIVLSFPNADKTHIPIGSAVFLSNADWLMLYQGKST